MALGIHFSWTGFIWAIMSILTLFRVNSNTFIGKFFRWLPFGGGEFAPIYDFLVNNYSFFASALIMLLFVKKTSNIYILSAIGIVCFLFLKFVLKF